MMKLRLLVPLLALGLFSGLCGSFEPIQKQVDAFLSHNHAKNPVKSSIYTALIETIVNFHSADVDRAYTDFPKKARALHAVGETLWKNEKKYAGCSQIIVEAIDVLVTMYLNDLQNTDTVIQVNGVNALVELIEKGGELTFPEADQRIPIRLRRIQSRLLQTTAGTKFRKNQEEAEAKKVAEEADAAREEAERKTAEAAARKVVQDTALTQATAKATTPVNQLIQEAKKPARFTLASKLMLFSVVAATVTSIALFAFQNRKTLAQGKFNLGLNDLWPFNKRSVVKSMRI